ncbi:hypothetical protein BDN70DRAFT_888275 [Pholiota conissans]|uniref:Uncharacterized protein n=1 Tax=Pholiota conissans TaxID=109636 RepID=A0A9P6CLM1_9AGAR|nr:hypothetical protein BDN70DRAFT_888275 [Pholiota conissans]
MLLHPIDVKLSGHRFKVTTTLSSMPQHPLHTGQTFFTKLHSPAPDETAAHAAF